ncbi:MAG: response regulator transcription factor FixJ [Mesorhizobium sp.]|nr:response regulator transcription factor FixJ [Mesorhizobium sp. M5C.F.Cr.IN.023.01.1.1]RWF88682.1 MAG: response regulator transcription factor FixJ [Mesorhizobium sp.]RWF92926.1 MAG: response regulator transcription factor FixJ [Mesorhizobium sp.]RWI41249.1 MAG: response regulator transcription factor FixJ [Mesorhizobium sp.]RWI49759.1 MAG: response regulator transcription factor FixJ [Mesorhizobium sp.]
MQIGDYIVHIVDDEEAVRNSLAFLLTKSGFSVRVHDSATAFLSAAPSIRNGCLVTDLRMPDMSGVELLKRIRELPVRIPSIVITGHGDVPMAVEAMRAGALDFIEKPFEKTVLIESIKNAASELSKTAAGVDVSVINARLGLLSEREREVMTGVVAGLPNKTIAYDLNISPKTVEVHRGNVMAKMEARNLPELVRMALTAGIGPR